MTKSSLGTRAFPILLSVPLALAGCADGPGADTPVPPSPSAQGPGGPGGPPPGGPEPAVTEPGIRQIMVKLTKGPNSLTPLLGRELKEDQPPWETIQGQTREFARLAEDMKNYDPPKGSKESWAKLTASYAGSAAVLDRAAGSKDRDAALAAHGVLSRSCMGCHREHRKMGPGMGGPPGRGPGGPGGPGGGPPPGPGGPPPG